MIAFKAGSLFLIDGLYRRSFQAGSICTAGFWRLQDKIGLSLEDIHSRGVVPGWKEKLKFSMERFFQKLKADKPVERNNVSFLRSFCPPSDQFSPASTFFR